MSNRHDVENAKDSKPFPKYIIILLVYQKGRHSMSNMHDVKNAKDSKPIILYFNGLFL